jgi:hypothetical protein
MIRKRHVIAVLALAALLAAGQPSLRHRLAAQTRNFQQRFEELKGAGNTISPFERIVFSLALAGAAPEGTIKDAP